jgi:hypothetical protein
MVMSWRQGAAPSNSSPTSQLEELPEGPGLVAIDLLNRHRYAKQLQHLLRLTDHPGGEADESVRPSDVPQVNVIGVAFCPQAPGEERSAASIYEARQAKCRQQYGDRHQPNENETRNSRYEGEDRNGHMRCGRQCAAPGVVGFDSVPSSHVFAPAPASHGSQPQRRYFFRKVSEGARAGVSATIAW